MKTIFFMIAIFLISISSVFAAGTQVIDCRYPDAENSDHVIISLSTAQLGTFFYSSGLDDNDDTQQTGKLTLKRDEKSKPATKKKDYADFMADWSSNQDGNIVTVHFIFSMPETLILKDSKSFTAELNTSIESSSPLAMSAGDELICSTKIK